MERYLWVLETKRRRPLPVLEDSTRRDISGGWVNDPSQKRPHGPGGGPFHQDRALWNPGDGFRGRASHEVDISYGHHHSGRSARVLHVKTVPVRHASSCLKPPHHVGAESVRVLSGPYTQSIHVPWSRFWPWPSRDQPGSKYGGFTRGLGRAPSGGSENGRAGISFGTRMLHPDELHRLVHDLMRVSRSSWAGEFVKIETVWAQALTKVLRGELRLGLRLGPGTACYR
ncbi:hypothetical protein B0T18DRAFT_184853 [Schizothecium vesticola]|uniref:Uncharacterized protein n=1 Tax=Schizothecium vesticola TaxID=314040 RepID=A0AA40K2C7_9PEZI|nr:hypothetical protein B0T18DRAFT_184853 [Schizothecium vesticola]